jgi:hypothetical protein
MFTCFTKSSSVINLDLFWKQVFSYITCMYEIKVKCFARENTIYDNN